MCLMGCAASPRRLATGKGGYENPPCSHHLWGKQQSLVSLVACGEKPVFPLHAQGTGSLLAHWPGAFWQAPADLVEICPSGVCPPQDGTCVLDCSLWSLLHHQISLMPTHREMKCIYVQCAQVRLL